MNMRQQKQMSDCPETMYTSEAHAQALELRQRETTTPPSSSAGI